MSSLLIISALFPPEPVVSANLSKDIAETFAENNDVLVICPFPTRPDGFSFNTELINTRYKVKRIKSFTSPKSTIIGRFYESYSFGRSCVRYMRKDAKKYKCIYINSWPLLSQYMIVKEAKRNNIPCVLHVQDIYPESLLNKISFGKGLVNKLLLPIDKYILHNSELIIAISENMKRSLVATRNIPSEKVEIIPNWQDERSFINYRPNCNTVCLDKNTTTRFMYLGNIGPVAGIDYVIRAFHKAKLENAELVIAGEGSRKMDCMHLVNELEINNIKFLEVPEGMVPAVQDQADVLLLPVKKNAAMSSIPSKLPAYMFSSKPIIGSLDIESDTAKAIVNSGCGLVVPPEDEGELINAFVKASEWSVLERIQKGNCGFEYAMQHFSKKSNLLKLVLLINRLL